MPRVRYVSISKTYTNLATKTFEHREANDCSVKAVSIATGAPYDEAHLALEICGRKPRRGACENEIAQALDLLGFKFTRAAYHDFVPSVRKARGITSRHPYLHPHIWNDGNKYLVFTSGHVFAVVDGINHDFSVNKLLRVIRIWKIERA